MFIFESFCSKIEPVVEGMIGIAVGYKNFKVNGII